MRIGIVGHGEDKFTEIGKINACNTIEEIMKQHNTIYSVEELVIVSGHCPIGGIDIWAEEIAKSTGIKTDIKTPKNNSWNGDYGFKARNLDIAKYSDIVYVILADSFPVDFKGKKYNYCYHCKTDKHIKSGGCWTALKAIDLGKKAKWIIVKNN